MTLEHRAVPQMTVSGSPPAAVFYSSTPSSTGRRPSFQREVLAGLFAGSSTHSPPIDAATSSLSSNSSEGTLRHQHPSLADAVDSLTLYHKDNFRVQLPRGPTGAGRRLGPKPPWVPSWREKENVCTHGVLDGEFCYSCFMEKGGVIASSRVEAGEDPDVPEYVHDDVPHYDDLVPSGRAEPSTSAPEDERPLYEGLLVEPEATEEVAEDVLTLSDDESPRAWKGRYRPPTLPRISLHNDYDSEASPTTSPVISHSPKKSSLGKRVTFNPGVTCSLTFAKEHYHRAGDSSFWAEDEEEEESDDEKEEYDWGEWTVTLHSSMRRKSGSVAPRDDSGIAAEEFIVVDGNT